MGRSFRGIPEVVKRKHGRLHASGRQVWRLAGDLRADAFGIQTEHQSLAPAVCCWPRIPPLCRNARHAHPGSRTIQPESWLERTFVPALCPAAGTELRNRESVPAHESDADL